jgi:uncharacterized protein
MRPASHELLFLTYNRSWIRIPTPAARASLAQRSVVMNLVVKDTGTAKGRGVYSTCALLSGELIEESPVVFISTPFGELPHELKEIVFNWRLLSGSGSGCAIALGYGSLFNHGEPANMRCETTAAAIRFLAVRDIAAGEELTINYNAVGDHDWFEEMNIEPLP